MHLCDIEDKALDRLDAKRLWPADRRQPHAEKGFHLTLSALRALRLDGSSTRRSRQQTAARARTNNTQTAGGKTLHYIQTGGDGPCRDQQCSSHKHN